MKKAIILLSIDSLGALFVGGLTLLLHNFLSDLYHIPKSTLLFIGFVNFIYGLYSGSLLLFLKQGNQNIRKQVSFLILANSLWTGVCFTQAWYLHCDLSMLGLIHLTGEGFYVFGLAFLELRYVYPVVGSPRST